MLEVMYSQVNGLSSAPHQHYGQPRSASAASSGSYAQQQQAQAQAQAQNSSSASSDALLMRTPSGQLQHYNIVSLSGTDPKERSAALHHLPPDRLIIDVWQDNLYQELQHIMSVVDDYNYIAMDTEFPGVVARPVGSFKNSHDYHYQTLKCNVDLLKIIQLGICLCDQYGNIIPGRSCWQFNFQFSLSEDMYAQDSIDLLAKSGIDFSSHASRGIDVTTFGELFIQSGIILNEDIRWLSFHSGYDFGYLLKLITAQSLPSTESEFFEWMLIYFPCVYDIKYLMKSCENLNGGLQKVAEMLNLERIGPQHQAGSDSLLTAATFFKLRQVFFNNSIDEQKFMNILYGLGNDLILPDPNIRKKKMIDSSSLLSSPNGSNDSSSGLMLGGRESSTASTATSTATAPPPGFA